MFRTKVTEMSPLAGFAPAGKPANRQERSCATRDSMKRIVNGFLGILHGRAGVSVLSKRLGILGAFAILPAMAQAPAEPPSPTALYSFAGGSDRARPFAASENQKASCPTQVVTYQFSGEFGGAPIKGPDFPLQLAGEPFSFTLYVCESRQPSKTGPDDAIYSGIELTGTLGSGFVSGPILIRPTAMTFGLVRPSRGSDAVGFEGNFAFVGILIHIHGTIALPAGTLAATSIAPFSQVSIVPAGSTFAYSWAGWQASHAYSVGEAITDPSGNQQYVATAGTSGTTAPAWDDTVGGTTTDGTVVWTCEGAILTELSVTGTASGTAGAPPSAKADAVLHPSAVQVITVHADGSQTLRPPVYRSLYGQRAEAAAAKAAAGEALARAADAMPAPNVAGTFIEFDAPGAGTGFGQGTFPFAINPVGTIVGYYNDASYIGHGFVRTAGGTIVTFDAPDQVNGTNATAINAEGTVTGYYNDANYNGHGFVRTWDGAITEFDAPNDVYGTYPAGIDDAGVVAGTYYDANNIHGFLRSRKGTIVTFDDPSAGTGVFQGTSAEGIDALGAVAGCYTDSSSASYAFLRARDGAFTTLAPPTSTGDSPGCRGLVLSGPTMAINSFGAIASNYFEPSSGNPFGGDYRGFLRSPDGAYATFDAATYTPCCIWTFPLSVNWAGTIAGYFNDGYSEDHGFVRDSAGAITILDAPNASQGANQGTVANGINLWGTVTGWYIDANFAYHGFLWRP